MATDIVDTYSKFLIKQYYEKPKARAHVELFLYEFQQIADVSRDFINWLDIDTTTGIWLDIIGNIVQLPRKVSNILSRSYFGFSDNPDAKGFYDFNEPSIESAPFYDGNSSVYGEYQLDDELYRKLIKAKIGKNNVSAFMSSDERVSIQDVIESIFEDEAYVIDNQDMTLSLYVSENVSDEYLRLIINLDLLPKPMAVSYIINEMTGENI